LLYAALVGRVSIEFYRYVMNQAAALHGLRLLVVEDEAMVALMLEDMLGLFGCVVVDVAGTLAKGMAVAGDALVSIDGAILDINLGGERVFPVAARLTERGVPFIFCTGYGRVDQETGFAHVPVLGKPYMQEELRKVLVSALTSTRKH
jgi:CheY-like chemotaxis protein